MTDEFDGLVITDLAVSYGQVRAVDGVTLTVPAGSLIGLLGPNGAGKTSLLNAVAGVVRPSAGSIHLGDTDLTRLPAHKVATSGLRLVPEGRALFPDMTVVENLIMGAPGATATDADIKRITDVFPILADRRTQRAGTLSGGEQQQLAIGRALIARPSVLVLDEPSMGLAPLIVADIVKVLKGLTAEGLSVLLAEQNALAVIDSLDAAVVMDRGRILAQGSSDRIRPMLQDGYLVSRGSGEP